MTRQCGVWVEMLDEDGRVLSAEWLRVAFEPRFYDEKERADALAVSWINDWHVPPGQAVRMTTATLGGDGLPARRMTRRTRAHGETRDWSPGEETDEQDHSLRTHGLLRG